MNPFDIFQKLPCGTRTWVCGVSSIQEAKARLIELQHAVPAEYYACDLDKRTVVVAITQERPEPHTPADDSTFFGSRYGETAWHRTPALGQRPSPQFGWAAR